ncbi:carbon storage regulator [Salirhabdus euzebyi]|uniref:Translational regulator CsrA n=1 Tax=Salirhabdus euzebyi TaxID=394506 RepID=A0A841Q5F8_9BACI|nr:carbon storage regulator CsrA [Salirhabdus euzebyi]MBB6453625.1 carbon storage regulator [Salirhabdus euzebyi]
MLVLTRKTGESIHVGDEIEVKVLSIDGDQIKLGISAPKNVDIFRSEIYQLIQDENKNASQLSKDVLDFLKNNKNS